MKNTNRTYYLFIAVAALISLSSCGTYRINKTCDFGKISDLSELNGTYLNEELKGKGFRLMQFFDYRVKPDSIGISFPNDTTMLASYWDNGELVTQETIGKKKKKYFEVYYNKEQLIIPLIYSKISVQRIRVGRYKKTNDLLIRFLDEENASIFFIAGGYGGEKPYVYKKTEE